MTTSDLPRLPKIACPYDGTLTTIVSKNVEKSQTRIYRTAFLFREIEVHESSMPRMISWVLGDGCVIETDLFELHVSRHGAYFKPIPAIDVTSE